MRPTDSGRPDVRKLTVLVLLKFELIICSIGAFERQFSSQQGLCRPLVRFADLTEYTDGFLDGHTVDFGNIDDYIQHDTVSVAAVCGERVDDLQGGVLDNLFGEFFLVVALDPSAF